MGAHLQLIKEGGGYQPNVQLLLKHAGQVQAMKMLKRGSPTWGDLFEQIEEGFKPLCCRWSLEMPSKELVRGWVREVVDHCLFQGDMAFKLR